MAGVIAEITLGVGAETTTEVTAETPIGRPAEIIFEGTAALARD